VIFRRPNWWLRLPELFRQIVVFLSGMGVTAVLGELFNIGFELFGLPQFQTLTIIALCLATVFFVGSIYTRMERLADTLGITVEYVEEEYRVKEGIPYEGAIYSKLEELVRSSKTEILALVETYIDGKPSLGTDHSVRDKYLRALEEKLESKRDTGFRYERLCQLPPSSSMNGNSASSYLGNTTTEHFKRVLALKRRLYRFGKLEMYMKLVETQTLTSFILIDNRFIILEMDGVADDRAYPRGILIIEDRSRLIMDVFKRYYEQAKSYGGTTITSADMLTLPLSSVPTHNP